MKRIFSLCTVIAMLLCCFAGCQPQEKPLTEEEKALKELQDAWNAVVVEKTEKTQRIVWIPGMLSSAHFATADAEKISELLHYFESVESKDFQLVDAESDVSMGSGWLTLWGSSDYQTTDNMPLLVRISEDDQLFIKMGDGSDAVAYCLTKTVHAEELKDKIKDLNFGTGTEAFGTGGGRFILWL